MRKVLVLLLVSTISLKAYSQECDCTSTFEWLKSTFEQNDAGFEYYLKQKGEVNYTLLNKSIYQKTKSIDDLKTCQSLLLEWLHFFRTEHIDLKLINQTQNAKLSNSEIEKKYSNWEKVDVTLTDFYDKKKQNYEGVWVAENYTLGIIKKRETYLGFIIKADGVYWKEGQIKFKINLNSHNGIYYMKDHSAKTIDKVDMFENKYIRLGSYLTLRKKEDNFQPIPKIETYLKSINSHNPTLEKISNNTYLLRIPHMWYQYKKVIDSLITKNKKKLTQTKNLIIDIRNNGGGSDLTYEALLPLLYTNPIRTVGAEFLSSKINNTMLEMVINSEELDAETKDWAQKILNRANSNLNHFVKMGDNVVDIVTYDTVYQYPKNVAIIIDENVASASEQFLLDARQSKKVKVFGTTTAGGLDLANVFETVSPCNEFVLEYATSRSMRVPEMVIDEKGVQPDFYLDRTIPKYKWIDYVIKVLNE